MKQRDLIPELIDDLTRTEKLELYMKRKRLSYASIGKSIGATRSTAFNLLHAPRVPTHRYKQLLQAGIPEPLIPPARDIAPGPKPKKNPAS
ncbi:hypothetical protein [Halodesulfovibrio sp.]|jgi:hypothetical protein|uniref:hypothetical protein n=1 Tax=Halodesulfovibrio sp. TaxID=1912772 RepID=UPI0025E88C94|nr:hypothetical protein [Halodesulfovibrio sp.]MCT4534214.1 hypothetical protein [Halodesulfovibrio sp.]MCT4627315.1 hypothetical protein [Halodesulfovibrio sp.]